MRANLIEGARVADRILDAKLPRFLDDVFVAIARVGMIAS